MCQPPADAAQENEGPDDVADADFEGMVAKVRHHGRLVFVKLRSETGEESDLVFDWRFFDHEGSPWPFPASKADVKVGDLLSGRSGPPSGPSAPRRARRLHDRQPGTAPMQSSAPARRSGVVASAGCAPCPRCGASQRRFDLARGLRAHLRQAHAADLAEALAKGEDEGTWLERELTAAESAGVFARRGAGGAPGPAANAHRRGS
ncbi:unnamed protein product, partial [Symbiodinium natans]